MHERTNDQRADDREDQTDLYEAERTRRGGNEEPMADELGGHGTGSSDEKVETADPAMKDQPAEGGVEEAEPQRSWREHGR